MYKTMQWLLTLICCTALTANAFAGGVITRMSDRKVVSFSQMMADMENSDIIFIAEEHTNKKHHELQIAVIRSLRAKKIPLAIGLEMFQTDNQKYLDDWPLVYSNVKVSENPGAGIAPWNISRYNIVSENGSIYGIEKETGKRFKVVFYHFHFVRFLVDGSIDLGWNHIPESVIKHIYTPYLNLITSLEKKLCAIAVVHSQA